MALVIMLLEPTCVVEGIQVQLNNTNALCKSHFTCDQLWKPSAREAVAAGGGMDLVS